MTRGRETFFTLRAALALVDQAEAAGVPVLGLEGFIVGDHVFPALSRIADSSGATPASTWRDARALLRGGWNEAPTAADSLSSDAVGRYMVAVTLG